MKKYSFYIQCRKTGQVFNSGTCVESQIPMLRDEADDYSDAELVLRSIQ